MVSILIILVTKDKRGNKMKKIMMMVAAIMMVATMAQAGCEQYEYNELNKMSKKELIKEYGKNKEEQANYVSEGYFAGKWSDFDSCKKTSDKIYRTLYKKYNGKVSEKEAKEVNDYTALVAERFDRCKRIEKDLNECKDSCSALYKPGYRGSYYEECKKNCMQELGYEWGN